MGHVEWYMLQSGAHGMLKWDRIERRGMVRIRICKLFKKVAVFVDR